jgi:hypothetical protein
MPKGGHQVPEIARHEHSPAAEAKRTVLVDSVGDAYSPVMGSGGYLVTSMSVSNGSWSLLLATNLDRLSYRLSVRSGGLVKARISPDNTLSAADAPIELDPGVMYAESGHGRHLGAVWGRTAASSVIVHAWETN